MNCIPTPITEPSNENISCYLGKSDHLKPNISHYILLILSLANLFISSLLNLNLILSASLFSLLLQSLLSLPHALFNSSPSLSFTYSYPLFVSLILTLSLSAIILIKNAHISQTISDTWNDYQNALQHERAWYIHIYLYFT